MASEELAQIFARGALEIKRVEQALDGVRDIRGGTAIADGAGNASELT
jgi:hypothetical protein